MPGRFVHLPNHELDQRHAHYLRLIEDMQTQIDRIAETIAMTERLAVQADDRDLLRTREYRRLVISLGGAQRGVARLQALADEVLLIRMAREM